MSPAVRVDAQLPQTSCSVCGPSCGPSHPFGSHFILTFCCVTTRVLVVKKEPTTTPQRRKKSESLSGKLTAQKPKEAHKSADVPLRPQRQWRGNRFVCGGSGGRGRGVLKSSLTHKMEAASRGTGEQRGFNLEGRWREEGAAEGRALIQH